MPCSSDWPDDVRTEYIIRDPALLQRCDHLTALLCETCRKLYNEGKQDLLTEQVRNWYKEHRYHDQKL